MPHILRIKTQDKKGHAGVRYGLISQQAIPSEIQKRVVLDVSWFLRSFLDPD